MPPRIRVASTLPARFVTCNMSRSIRPFLTPASQFPASILPQHGAGARSASILSDLRANPGEHHKAIRRGRGASSGKGKTSGRGHKGQKQHGKVPAGFEGGQTPQHIVQGPRGFVNVHSDTYNVLPLSRILSWIAQGRIDPTKPITVRELALSGCVNNIKDGVKLLANSRSHEMSIDEVPPCPHPLTIVVSRASEQAIAAVEKTGGSVLTRYYTRWAIQKIIKGQMDPLNSLESFQPVYTPIQSKKAKATPGGNPEAVPEGGAKVVDGGNAEAAPQAKTEISPAVAEDEAAEVSIVSTRPVPSGPPEQRYPFRLPDATSRKAREYYRDPAHRGYLSHQVKGKGGKAKNPSLLFKSVQHESSFGAGGKKAKEQDRDRLF